MRCSRRDEPWGSHQSAARALKWETSSGLTDEDEDEECHRGRAAEGVTRRGVDERVAWLRVRRQAGRRRGAAMAARARRCWRSGRVRLLKLGEDDKADVFWGCEDGGLCGSRVRAVGVWIKVGRRKPRRLAGSAGQDKDRTGSARVTLARVCQSQSAISNEDSDPGYQPLSRA